MTVLNGIHKERYYKLNMHKKLLNKVQFAQEYDLKMHWYQYLLKKILLNGLVIKKKFLKFQKKSELSFLG